MATITRNEKVAGSALANPSVADAVADALGRDPISGEILASDEIRWSFYRKRLTDLSGQHSFTVTRTTSKWRIKTDGYLEEISSGNPAYTAADGGGAIQGLRCEEARTNLLPYSNDFSQSNWQKTNITHSADAGVADMGGDTGADKILVTASGSSFLVDTSIPATEDAYYCYSIYCKYGSLTAGRSSRVRWSRGALVHYLDLTWTAGVPSRSADSGTVSYGIEEQLDGWYRVWMTAQANLVGLTTVDCYWYSDQASAVANDYMYIDRAQFELVQYADSKPSSYISTEGAAGVRNRDDVKCPTSAIDLRNGCTFYANCYLSDTEGSASQNSTLISYQADNLAEQYILIKYTTDGDVGFISDNGPTQKETRFDNGTTVVNRWSKFAATLDVSGTPWQSIWSNGALHKTDTTGVEVPPDPVNLDYILIGQRQYLGVPDRFCRDVIFKEVRIYEKALSLSEIEALTT